MEFLLRCRIEPSLADLPLERVIADDLASGTLIWFPAYAQVHRDNLAVTLAA